MPRPAAPQRRAASHPAPSAMSSLQLKPTKSPGGSFINVLSSKHLVSSGNARQKEFQGQTPRALRAGSPSRLANAAHLYKHISSPHTSPPASHFCLTTSLTAGITVPILQTRKQTLFSGVREDPGLNPNVLALNLLCLNLQTGMYRDSLELAVLDCSYLFTRLSFCGQGWGQIHFYGLGAEHWAWHRAGVRKI